MRWLINEDNLIDNVMMIIDDEWKGNKRIFCLNLGSRYQLSKKVVRKVQDMVFSYLKQTNSIKFLPILYQRRFLAWLLWQKITLLLVCSTIRATTRILLLKFRIWWMLMSIYDIRWRLLKEMNKQFMRMFESE